MKLRLSDLWRWDGEIGRAAYALLGALILTIKHNLDRFVAWRFFHRPWSVFNYLRPDTAPPDRPPDSIFLLTLLLLSMPFMWTGVVLTLRRLRNAKLPPPSRRRAGRETRRAAPPG